MTKKRKKHSSEEIVRILREADGSKTILEVCRARNITEQTFHRWKKKYQGLDLAEVKRLKALEKENGELKKMLADALLDIRALKLINEKKWQTRLFESCCSSTRN